jgi:HAD superfamily hydrolase (TIGR01549 family)
MKKKLLLFDIDGTLVVGNKTHTFAMKKALREVFGYDTEILVKDVTGKTDRQIMTESLIRAGISKKEIDTKVNSIIQNMLDTFTENGISDMKILPGVKELLEKLSKRNDIIIGLLTGNPEKIAYFKLDNFRIRDYFIFGAFGHEHNHRSELVKDAVDRAEKEFSDIEEIIIIGDSERDIEAAKANDLRVIAVATGYSDKQKLKDKEPDFLFDNLKDTEKVLHAIDLKNKQ